MNSITMVCAGAVFLSYHNLEKNKMEYLGLLVCFFVNIKLRSKLEFSDILKNNNISKLFKIEAWFTQDSELPFSYWKKKSVSIMFFFVKCMAYNLLNMCVICLWCTNNMYSIQQFICILIMYHILHTLHLHSLNIS